MRDDREKLKDILEAIERIETYSAKGRAAFEQDELIQVWFLGYLQIIGEASQAISSNIRETHPEVPWAKIIGMRNILVHNYFEIDLPVVWNAVERELPELKRQLTSIIKKSEEA
ncbi:MAG: DUF86 domain-containing protein [Desulfobaccales bacterium]|jgi:uncharacterized protein with HEPN domain